MYYRNLRVSSLIDRCVEKDSLAWAEFVKRFTPLVDLSAKKTLLRCSAGRNASSEDISDIRQNILTALWSRGKLGEVRQRENINYWLAITTRNATLNYIRAKQKEVLIADQSFFENIPEKRGREFGAIERKERSERIKKIYSILKPREKIIFRLYFEKELDLKDVSKIMGMPIGTVSSHITRIRKKCSKTQ